MKILQGDCRETLKTLPDESVQCVVTSPPYFALRDYGNARQIGLEKTPEDYTAELVSVFREVWRVLKNDGTLFLNLGDSYSGSGKGRMGDGTTACKPGTKQFTNRGSIEGVIGNSARENAVTKEAGQDRCFGLKPKDLIGIPWRVAFALQADGWYLRSDIVWHKPNPMPESVTDRPTRSHEFIFLLTKSQKYFYDYQAIREKAVTMDDDKSHHSFGTAGGKDEATPKAHRNSGKKWNPKMGGGGTSFNGHSGNYKANGEPICGVLRNKRDVWTVPLSPYADSHFATFPPDLIKPCIMAGSRHGDFVLDPFAGSGTTGMVAIELGRKPILCELNPDYCKMIEQRTNVTPGMNLA